MKCCHYRDRAKRMPAPAHVLHRLDFSEQTAHRCSAQSNHYFRLNKLDLLPEIRQTSFHLSRRRLAISRCTWGNIRTAFQHVSNVDARTLKPHRLDYPSEQFAGASDKRFALHVFVGARSFTDKHQLRRRVADTENNGVSKRNQVRTLGAGEHLRPQLFKRLRLSAFHLLRRLVGGLASSFGDDSLTNLRSSRDGRIFGGVRISHRFSELRDPPEHASVRTEFRTLFQPA